MLYKFTVFRELGTNFYYKSILYCRKDAKNKGENITSKSSKCKVRKIVLAFKGTYTIWKKKIEKYIFIFHLKRERTKILN